MILGLISELISLVLLVLLGFAVYRVATNSTIKFTFPPFKLEISNRKPPGDAE